MTASSTLGKIAPPRTRLLRYAAFAAAAIAINLLSQTAVLLVAVGYRSCIYAAILYGNVAGLVFKYICDKRWVFEDAGLSVKADGKKFGLYTFFGLFTTAIFWAVELAFHYIFQTQLMTTVGGAIGLIIGYVVK